MTHVSPTTADVARGRFGARPGERAKLADLGAAGAGSDNTLYVLLFVTGAIVVVPTLIRGGVWGVEATLGAVLCVLAGRALLFSALSYIRHRNRD